MVKKILSIVLWVITAAALIMLFVFGRKKYRATPLKGIRVNVELCQAKGFIEKDSLIAQIWSLCDKDQPVTIANIDMEKIRQLLDSNPWIAHSDAYIGLNDSLIINIKEYDPVLRMYAVAGHKKTRQSFYVTRDGFIIPTSSRYIPHLIIANGNYDLDTLALNSNIADSLYLNSGLVETLTIAQAIEKDNFFKQNIGQIYRNTSNEYEIVVNNLPIQVIVGDTCAIDNKLQRLKRMLESPVEMEEYKTMSLKYKNQIVCTKK